MVVSMFVRVGQSYAFPVSFHCKLRDMYQYAKWLLNSTKSAAMLTNPTVG